MIGILVVSESGASRMTAVAFRRRLLGVVELGREQRRNRDQPDHQPEVADPDGGGTALRRVILARQGRTRKRRQCKPEADAGERERRHRVSRTAGRKERQRREAGREQRCPADDVRETGQARGERPRAERRHRQGADDARPGQRPVVPDRDDQED